MLEDVRIDDLEDGLFDIADNNNGFFGPTLIITLFGVSISCDLLHQMF